MKLKEVEGLRVVGFSGRNADLSATVVGGSRPKERCKGR